MSDYNYVVVADGESGVALIDLTNPFDPSLGDSFDTSGYAYGVTTRENYIYVADAGNGLRIFTIHPDVPLLSYVGGVDTFEAQAVAVQGNHAYVADGGVGLTVISIINPANPQVVGRLFTLGFARGVAVQGNYAYVQTGDAGMHVIDVCNPANPRRLGGYDTGLFGQQLAIRGNYGYVANFWSGVSVLELFPAGLTGQYIHPDNGFTFSVHGYPGTTVQLQRSSDLRDWVDWESPFVLGATPFTFSDDDNFSSTQYFFRAIER